MDSLINIDFLVLLAACAADKKDQTISPKDILDHIVLLSPYDKANIGHGQVVIAFMRLRHFGFVEKVNPEPAPRLVRLTPEGRSEVIQGISTLSKVTAVGMNLFIEKALEYPSQLVSD